MNVADVIMTLGGALLLGCLIPWVLMRMLLPSLTSAERASVSNYRGHRVSPGLGIVWLLWAGCAFLGGVLFSAVFDSSGLVMLTLAGPLALVAFALGVVDDAYGTSDAKGFRGHLKAMFHGRLTTGGLKLLGIGLASLVAALVVGGVAPWGGETASTLLVGTLIAGAAIALTSNFVNLMDLRPGRALKVYLALAVLGAASAGFGLMGIATGDLPLAERALTFAGLAIFLVGPVLAVWRHDLGEVAMLGDAGANPMGAVAGLLIVCGLPLWALVAYLIVMFALNLASERFSFSRVIAGNRFLSWLDGLGRLPLDPEPAAGSTDSETDPHEGVSPE